MKAVLMSLSLLLISAAALAQSSSLDQIMRANKAYRHGHWQEFKGDCALEIDDFTLDPSQLTVVTSGSGQVGSDGTLFPRPPGGSTWELDPVQHIVSFIRDARPTPPLVSYFKYDPATLKFVSFSVLASELNPVRVTCLLR